MQNETTTPNVADILAAQFAQMEPIEIKIPGIDIPMTCDPLSLEDKLEQGAIASVSDHNDMALKMAQFIVKRVKLENGEKAFRNTRNLPAAEVLTKMVKPDHISHIYEQMSGLDVSDQIEDLEGKSETPESAS